jgi:hypothetical protein
VEQEVLDSDKADELGTILQMLPEMMDKFRAEFGLLSGKSSVSNLSSTELASLERKIKKLYLVAKQLETVKDEDLTPTSARKRLSLMNSFFGLITRRNPKSQEPIDYMIESIERIRRVPSNQGLPKGLNYTIKHDGLCVFIDGLLAIVPKSDVDLFLSSGLSEHQLVSQFQRALNNLSLPKGLRTPPSRATVQTMEKLKLALHDVTTDWEGLIDLVYGLILLKEGSVPSWAAIRKVALWDKVGKVNQEPSLGGLVKSEWVTVRNVIDHGRAFLVPSEGKIRFPDRSRTISWSFEQAYIEAVDIYLANQAMLRIWNIVQTVGFTDFIKQIELLRALASLKYEF